MENEDREPDTTLIEALEAYSYVALAGPSACSAASAAAAAAYGSSGSVPRLSAAAAAAAAGSLPLPLASSSAASAGAGGGSSCSPGPPPNWGAVLPAELVANLGRYRRYDYTSLRDLLRVVRNKRNHFREMPPSLQVGGRRAGQRGRGGW